MIYGVEIQYYDYPYNSLIIGSKTCIQGLIIGAYRICMHLGCIAVIELDSYPEHNKGQEPSTLRWSKDPSQ